MDNVSDEKLMAMALQVIEVISVEEQDMITSIDQANHLMGLFYRLAHAGRRPSCKDRHANWESDIIKMYEELENNPNTGFSADTFRNIINANGINDESRK